MTLRNRILSIVISGAALCLAADDLPPLPDTPKKPVTDTYQGVQVIDDYRWLEPPADPDVRKWSEQQNTRTRTYLDRLPSRAAITERPLAPIAVPCPSGWTGHQIGRAHV